MATRIEEILIRCRDSLADEDKSRWSGNRLLRLVDEAQKKIATKAQLLRKTTTVSILANINEYQLPSDAFLITRVVNEAGAKIEVKSHADMDDLMSNILLHDPLSNSYRRSSNTQMVDAIWENDIGSSVEYIVFDNQAPGSFKTYPIVSDVANGETFVTDAYGVTSAVTEDILSDVYGVVTDIAVTALETNQFNSVYGVVTAMSEITEVLRVYYRAKPADITSDQDTLEIDDKWDAAIKHYVVSMALHDDQDTRNRAVSSDELQLYSLEFTEAKKLSSKDNMSRSGNRTTYNSEI